MGRGCSKNGWESHCGECAEGVPEVFEIKLESLRLIFLNRHYERKAIFKVWIKQKIPTDKEKL